MNHFPVLLLKSLHAPCASQARACVLCAKLLLCCCPRTWPARDPGAMQRQASTFVHTSHLSSFHLVSCLPICQPRSSWLCSCHLIAAQTFSCIGATVDGRNDEIFKPLLSSTTPSPPKFNVILTWSALAPMDEKNQTPNITFANTRAETLRFGVRGFNIVRAAGFEYFVHLLSRSLKFSHLLVYKLCCGNINVHAADLLPNCAKHWLFTSKCLLSVSRPIFPHIDVSGFCF